MKERKSALMNELSFQKFTENLGSWEESRPLIFERKFQNDFEHRISIHETEYKRFFIFGKGKLHLLVQELNESISKNSTEFRNIQEVQDFVDRCLKNQSFL